MCCGQKSSKVLWRCHQLLSAFLANGHWRINKINLKLTWLVSKSCLHCCQKFLNPSENKCGYNVFIFEERQSCLDGNLNLDQVFSVKIKRDIQVRITFLFLVSLCSDCLLAPCRRTQIEFLNLGSSY